MKNDRAHDEAEPVSRLGRGARPAHEAVEVRVFDAGESVGARHHGAHRESDEPVDHCLSA